MAFKIANRKGEEYLLSVAIFLILNLVFIVLLGVFVYRASSHAIAYEQVYSKKIVLFLDNGISGEEINIDISKGLEIADKNKQTRDKIFTISNGRVNVSLAPKGGYSFAYFTDYDVKYEIVGDKLKINLEDKK